MKLLFNPKTCSIVLSLGDKYYDMRNGQELEDMKLPALKPFKRYNKSSKVDIKPKKEYLMIGNIKITFHKYYEQYQYGAYLPRYFFKALNKLINDGILRI